MFDEKGESIYQKSVSKTSGLMNFIYFDENQKLSSKSTSGIGNIINITTNKEINLTYLHRSYNENLSHNHEFLGWYKCDNDKFKNPTLISTNPNVILDLDDLRGNSLQNENNYYFGSEINHIYAMIKERIIKLNVNFIYEDVEEYTGFASYGTELKPIQNILRGGKMR